jgi:hypothetical protein
LRDNGPEDFSSLFPQFFSKKIEARLKKWTQRAREEDAEREAGRAIDRASKENPEQTKGEEN